MGLRLLGACCTFAVPHLDTSGAGPLEHTHNYYGEIMKIILFIIMFLFMIISGFAQPIPIDSLYLGQTPPDSIPKIFNLPVTPGYFAGDRIAISNDGKSIYYNELNGYNSKSKARIKWLRYGQNKWNGPFILFEGYVSPGLSISGDTMFMEYGGSFYSVRNDTGWEDPKKFLVKPNFVHYLEVTNNGTFYFTTASKISSRGDISRIFMNDSNSSLQSLPSPVNSSLNGIDFYIAKDESYIIFPEIISGSGDLFISYKITDSIWTNPKDLGAPINTLDWEYGIYISPDNKYLFFSRSSHTATNTYWVKIGNLIDNLKQASFGFIEK